MSDAIRDLEIERAEALGSLLSMVDCVIQAKEIPDFFSVTEQVEILRMRRKAYDEADAAYRNARLEAL